MILRLTRGMAEVALRIQEYGGGRTLADMRHVQLLIYPGQHDAHCHWEGGSPWILTGCWPLHRTGVDIANPHRNMDFPTLVLSPYKTDTEGRLVFALPSDLWGLPMGRYTGEVRALLPGRSRIINHKDNEDVGKKVAPEDKRILPHGYQFGNTACLPPDTPLPPAHRPRREVCVLYTFDIDLWPECSSHWMDQVTVEFPLNTCGDLCYGDS